MVRFGSDRGSENTSTSDPTCLPGAERDDSPVYDPHRCDVRPGTGMRTVFLRVTGTVSVRVPSTGRDEDTENGSSRADDSNPDFYSIDPPCRN